jgi:hypothetical protein
MFVTRPLLVSTHDEQEADSEESCVQLLMCVHEAIDQSIDKAIQAEGR